MAHIAIVGAQDRSGRFGGGLGSRLARLSLVGAEILARLAALEAVTLIAVALETVTLWAITLCAVAIEALRPLAPVGPIEAAVVASPLPVIAKTVVSSPTEAPVTVAVEPLLPSPLLPLARLAKGALLAVALALLIGARGLAIGLDGFGLGAGLVFEIDVIAGD